MFRKTCVLTSCHIIPNMVQIISKVLIVIMGIKCDKKILVNTFLFARSTELLTFVYQVWGLRTSPMCHCFEFFLHDEIWIQQSLFKPPHRLQACTNHLLNMESFVSKKTKIPVWLKDNSSEAIARLSNNFILKLQFMCNIVHKFDLKRLNLVFHRSAW